MDALAVEQFTHCHINKLKEKGCHLGHYESHEVSIFLRRFFYLQNCINVHGNEICQTDLAVDQLPGLMKEVDKDILEHEIRTIIVGDTVALTAHGSIAVLEPSIAKNKARQFRLTEVQLQYKKRLTENEIAGLNRKL